MFPSNKYLFYPPISATVPLMSAAFLSYHECKIPVCLLGGTCRCRICPSPTTLRELLTTGSSCASSWGTISCPTCPGTGTYVPMYLPSSSSADPRLFFLRSVRSNLHCRSQKNVIRTFYISHFKVIFYEF